jgi:hypothetical protein
MAITFSPGIKPNSGFFLLGVSGASVFPAFPEKHLKNPWAQAPSWHFYLRLSPN